MMSQDHIDIDAVLKWYADDCTYGYSSDFGEAGSQKGKKAIAEFFREWEKEVPKRKFEVNNITFAAWPLMLTNVYVVDWTLTGIKKDGKEFRYNGFSVCHHKNFKLVRGWDYWFLAGPPQISTPTKPTAN
jgi:ketosteroid isomerase-like protein